MAVPSMITDETKAATKNIQAALANGSVTLRPLAPCRLPPVVKAALAAAAASEGEVRPRVPAPCPPEVTEATKAIFHFPGIQAALDRLAAEKAAKACVEVLVKTAIANVVAQAEARECVAKMVQAAVDSVLAGAARKVAVSDATEVLDIEDASVSDEDIGAEVDALCELFVVECCDDSAEEFMDGVDGSDGAVNSSAFSEKTSSIVDPHTTDSQEAFAAAVDFIASISGKAACPADLDIGAADECTSKNWLEMPNDSTEAEVPLVRRSLAGQVPEFPLSPEADVLSSDLFAPAARRGDTATSHVGAANGQDNTTKQHSSRKKGGAGKKRSKAARQGKKGKHAKKGKKGRA